MRIANATNPVSRSAVAFDSFFLFLFLFLFFFWRRSDALPPARASPSGGPGDAAARAREGEGEASSKAGTAASVRSTGKRCYCMFDLCLCVLSHGRGCCAVPAGWLVGAVIARDRPGDRKAQAQAEPKKKKLEMRPRRGGGAARKARRGSRAWGRGFARRSEGSSPHFT